MNKYNGSIYRLLYSYVDNFYIYISPLTINETGNAITYTCTAHSELDIIIFLLTTKLKTTQHTEHLPIWQLSPVKPGEQLQVYVSPFITHSPPFTQGLEKHTSEAEDAGEGNADITM